MQRAPVHITLPAKSRDGRRRIQEGEQMAGDDYRDERDQDERRKFVARDRDEREQVRQKPDRRRQPVGRRRDDFIRAGYSYDLDDYERKWDPSYRHGWAGSGREGDYTRYARRDPGFERDTYERGRYGYRDDMEHGRRPDFDEDRYRYGLGAELDDIDDIPGYARGWRTPTPDLRGWNPPGPHVGRGPEGYQRPDERIVEDVNEELTWHSRIDARNIQVSAENGEVTLEGAVDSRSAKRRAEDAAEGVAGVRDVHNRLRIERSS